GLHHTLSSYITFCTTHVTHSSHIYTLSLHDALPIYHLRFHLRDVRVPGKHASPPFRDAFRRDWDCKRLQNQMLTMRGPGQGRERSEEHTSELKSRSDLVWRLLLAKKNKIMYTITIR